MISAGEFFGFWGAFTAIGYLFMVLPFYAGIKTNDDGMTCAALLIPPVIGFMASICVATGAIG